MFPLFTCQQRWFPAAEIQLMGREPSLSLAIGDERTTEMTDVKSRA
jgi:hypothetical protein